MVVYLFHDVALATVGLDWDDFDVVEDTKLLGRRQHCGDRFVLRPVINDELLKGCVV